MPVIWLTFGLVASRRTRPAEPIVDLRGRRQARVVINPLSVRDLFLIEMTLGESVCTVQWSFFGSK